MNNCSDDEESKLKIRARALKLKDANTIPKPCSEVLSHLKKKTSLRAVNCKTPNSFAKTRPHASHQTPDIGRQSPQTSTPRNALSPLKTNTQVTSYQSSNSSRASRRLEMDHVSFSSPTRNLPNSIIDGYSPHSQKKSGTKRKESDWLTDHIGRKSKNNSPSQSKMRRVK